MRLSKRLISDIKLALGLFIFSAVLTVSAAICPNKLGNDFQKTINTLGYPYTQTSK